ncbi:MAG: hypothetical protein ABH815_05110 [Candidatus Omnitrophota bacterium]
MDKTKVSLIIAPVVVSIICIILAVNVTIAKSQMNIEKAKAVGLNNRVQELGLKLSDANMRARLAQDLQIALNAAKQEAAAAKQEVETVRQQITALNSENSDLKARLSTAMEALRTPVVAAPAPAVTTETPVSPAE